MLRWNEVTVDFLSDDLAALAVIEKAFSSPQKSHVEWVAAQNGLTRREFLAALLNSRMFSRRAAAVDGHPGIIGGRYSNAYLENAWPALKAYFRTMSAELPEVVWLVHRTDASQSFGEKSVLKNGEVAVVSLGLHRQNQMYDWVLPDIFSPFRSEHFENLPFGTLWPAWMHDIREAVVSLPSQVAVSAAAPELDSASRKI